MKIIPRHVGVVLKKAVSCLWIHDRKKIPPESGKKGWK